MTEVTAFERFQDALERRSRQLSSFEFDYKAGFYESFLQGLSDSDPKVAGKLIAAALMIDKWADEHEQSERSRLTLSL